MAEMTWDTLQQEFWRLYQGGAYAEALDLVVRHEDLFDDRARFYNWKMCMAARASDIPLAIQTLQESLDAELWHPPAELREDDDLAPLQGQPAFERLAAISEERFEAAAARARPELLVVVPEGGHEPHPLLLAMHGNNSNVAQTRSFWAPAAARGWLVALPQSSQLSRNDAYVWTDRERAIPEVRRHGGALLAQYPIDPARVIVGGFSAGGGLALWLALSGEVAARGFVAFGPWLPDMPGVEALIDAYDGRDLRGYIVVGEQDDECLPMARQAVALLRARGIPCELTILPGLAHTYPPDAERHLERGLRFVMGEAVQ